jgi:hypothetical protein
MRIERSGEPVAHPLSRQRIVHMIEIEGTTYTRTRLVVDNQRFENCTFNECVLEFDALGPCQFVGCDFNDSPFTLGGAAAQTLKFISEVYKVSPQIVEATFDRVRIGL